MEAEYLQKGSGIALPGSEGRGCWELRSAAGLPHREGLHHYTLQRKACEAQEDTRPWGHFLVLLDTLWSESPTGGTNGLLRLEVTEL